MNEYGLQYSVPTTNNELSELLTKTAELHSGCEAFTHLSVDGKAALELFLCGRNSHGTLKRFVFSYGGVSYEFTDENDAVVCNNSTVSVFGEIIGTKLVRAIFTGKAHTQNTTPAGFDGSPSQSLSVFNSNVNEITHNANIVRLDGTQIQKVFKLISNGKPTVGDELRYVFRVRAVNRSFARVFGIFDKNGDLASTASIVAENEKYALIGDVFTRPDMCGNGFAAQLCLEACRCALYRNKTPWILCSEENLPFYQKTGFTPVPNQPCP